MIPLKLTVEAPKDRRTRANCCSRDFGSWEMHFVSKVCMDLGSELHGTWEEFNMFVI